MRLHTKLLISYLFVVLLPIVSIGYFLIHQTTKTVLKQTNYINQISFQQMEKNISSQLDSYLKLAKSVLSEVQLLNYIQDEHQESEYFKKYLEYDKIYTTYLTKLPLSLEDDFRISIYTTNDTILYDNMFIIKLDDQIKNELWYKDAIIANGDTIISIPYLNNNKQLVLAIGRILNPYQEQQSKYINLLKIEIRENNLFRLIETEGINKEIYLLDNNDYIITATKRELIGKKFVRSFNVLSDEAKQLREKSWEFNYDKKVIFLSNLTGPNPINTWKIVSIISSEKMLKNINEIVEYSLVICIISAAIAITLVYFFSNALTKRLSLLVRNMGKIREGRFEVFVSDDQTDEIGELAKSFKNMVERINALIANVYIAEMHVKDLDIKKKQAEINALQSQINPHFLFNTMESIRMNLLKKGDHETSEIIQKFAKLLRKSIDWSSDSITLQQEMEIVKNYLEIQNYRYRDKFKYEIEIPCESYQFIIPKFTLQPIVENAICHGLEMKEGTGKLQIRAQTVESGFEIIVRDDGVGMNENQLMKVREQIYGGQVSGSNAGIGLINVQHRLELCYGEGHGISINSAENVGTEVKILLPAVGHEKGNMDG